MEHAGSRLAAFLAQTPGLGSPAASHPCSNASTPEAETAEPAGPTWNDDPVLTAREAAAYTRYTRPDGRPQDKFYTAIRKHYGVSRPRLRLSEVHDLMAKGVL